MKKDFYLSENIINSIADQIYDSKVINRKTLNEHLLEMLNSSFNNYSIDYFFRENQTDNQVQSELIKKYGFMRFDVRGIKIRCIKD